jgi:hypothetical protein
MKRTVAIMQPTYLSWIGYFDLIDQSDCFIFLDSVQFDKRSWQQRNRIKTPDGEFILTVPVQSKGRYTQRIYEVLIDKNQDFHNKHIKTIAHNYSKAPFFSKYIDDIVAILNHNHEYLVDLNIELICWFAHILGIKTEFLRSSSLDAEGTKVELLYDICKRVGAERYLSPLGSKGYIDENNLFEINGIELRYHHYAHPTYHQLYGEFLPYLSVLDLLCNEGNNSLSILRQGRNT